MTTRAGCLVVISLAVASCGKSSSDSSGGAVADSKPATTTTTAKAADTKTPDKAPAHVDPPKGDIGPNGLPTDIPTTRSAVPTFAEWGAVPKEITVARSTPLGCTTKMLREWLQVSCHGKNDKGGEPVSVDNKAGASGDTYLFAKNKVTSLVMPVLRNHHYEGTFAWSDRKQLLVVDWPNGAPSPTIKFTDP